MSLPCSAATGFMVFNVPAYVLILNIATLYGIWFCLYFFQTKESALLIPILTQSRNKKFENQLFFIKARKTILKQFKKN